MLLECRGVVQGVGLRPALHRLAARLELAGSLHNATGLVRLDLRGERVALEAFLAALPAALPAAARLDSLKPRWLEIDSAAAGEASPHPQGPPGSMLMGECARQGAAPEPAAAPQGGLPGLWALALGDAVDAAAPEAADPPEADPPEVDPPVAGLLIGAEPAGAASPLTIGLIAPSLAADRAPCPDCLRELADPSNRRLGDPFLSCCCCGPRYSIATAEPWSRAHTTHAGFAPCPICAAEFADPNDRRFHAETISCPLCGPRLSLLSAAEAAGVPSSGEGGDKGGPPPDEGGATGPGPATAGAFRELLGPPPASGRSASAHHAALIAAAADLLNEGRILALQGVGGFQLLVDAADADAVARLRQRKRRPSKPFALLVAEPEWIAAEALICETALAQLRSPAAPIVLLPRCQPGGERPFGERHRRVAFSHDPEDSGAAAIAPAACDGVAPGSPSLGVMLPASPLHWLLCRRFGRPLVCTSGNRSGEPLCIDPAEALDRLAGLADVFLVHDRPIARPLDDSVLQLIDGRPALLRRARGYAPEPLERPGDDCARARPAAFETPSLMGPPAGAVEPWAMAAEKLLAVAGDQERPAAPSCPSPPHPGAAADVPSPPAVLALGGDLKSAPALMAAGRIWLAPHLGDLAERRHHDRLAAGLAELTARHRPLDALVCDRHPGYVSHQLGQALASSCAMPLLPVQHHAAHALAVIAEHGLAAPLLAFCADGLGYGDAAAAPAVDGASGPDPPGSDAPLWGGELLWIGPQTIERLACLRPLPLPGGERACMEPRRVALGLLASAGPAALRHPGASATLAAFDASERAVLLQMLARRLHCPLSSSLGRLFDAVASLLGVCQRLSHEGEAGLRLQGLAALALEQGGACDGSSLPPPVATADQRCPDAADPVAASTLQCPQVAARPWPLPLIASGAAAAGLPLGWLDWQPALAALLTERAAGVPPTISALRFHLGLAEGLAALLADAAQARGCRSVVLAGGCFQNALLLEALIQRLRRIGLEPHWAEAVPGNDGGLAVGQLEAWRRQAKRPDRAVRG